VPRSMTETIGSPTSSSDKRTNPSPAMHVDRLDTIRFLAASWVAVSHGALEIKPLADSGLLKVLLGGVQGSFNGIAAVVVFFIVSGLCIHLPHSQYNQRPGFKFLIRRYLRVCIPLLVILAIAHFVGGSAEAWVGGVTWSIYVELFYYTIYPMLYYLAKRWGWLPQIFISSAIAIVIVAFLPDQLFVRELGWLAAPWGLPIWLSGCLIADRFGRGQFPRLYGSLAFWRLFAWSVSVLSVVLLFHSPVKVGAPTCMLIFAPVAFAWLVKELTSARKVWPLPERWGAGSYSLYLVHALVLGALFDSRIALAPWVDLILRPCAVIAATAAFYFLVEAPSHKLARMAKALPF